MQAQHIGCPVTPVYQSLDSFRGDVRHNLASRHQFPFPMELGRIDLTVSP